MERIENVQEYIDHSLAEKDIVVPEEFRPVFENHVNVLSRRLENDECVNEDPSELEKQLSTDSIETSKEILKPLFLQFGVEENRSEIALFALYINLAKGGM
ncbi:MAG: PRD domain-containing protein [Erysipelotrichaceae bacterium]|nr:PRD domain-containing protein [Erysipelotrichaceae bacterium]